MLRLKSCGINAAAEGGLHDTLGGIQRQHRKYNRNKVQKTYRFKIDVICVSGALNVQCSMQGWYNQSAPNNSPAVDSVMSQQGQSHGSCIQLIPNETERWCYSEI